ncbi:MULTISPECIES: hypothetical protein [Streptomycetaceae]|uniref:Uncharacterized protein n=1 Tax=Streptantibioticus cattleyicolor (strain ATCC 35852 / DSM 46488 / JCM 4925 / NBRC 14057 / NRRL 8057) TaxID=1003195 RepID=F8JNV4_STREN|nr:MULTISPECIES: hypothetical protein [Streptomycetaceae]AEW92686.1 hypothetical protein SCATT_03150 [Streptantibioticus cattleyicolor NRRL 8057 = DSM 46488]MYS57456.1 hypothetical protein [Streptomyces sp. SID5468]CCB73043.1 exported protein of unknown function [Streptantibioticus cattleyicolor NRRL 8057 = DSM 46488]
MRMTRKTGVLLSTIVTGAVAVGAFGTATAAVGGHQTARVVTPAPAADPVAQVGQLENLGSVSKVAETLKVALTGRPDTARLNALAQQAKRTLDNVAGSTTTSTFTTRVAAPPNQLVMKAANQTKSSLDALVKAAATKNTKKISTAVRSVIQSSVNLAASLVLSSGLPAPTLPGLPRLPQSPGGPGNGGQVGQGSKPGFPGGQNQPGDQSQQGGQQPGDSGTGQLPGADG